MLANARQILHDGAQMMKALARAGVLPDLGHVFPWLNDLALRCVASMPEAERREATPASLRAWPSTDVSRDPLTMNGIQWPEVLIAAGEGDAARAPSALRSRADVDAVLATAECARAVVRGDAAAVLQLSGVSTDSTSLEALKERILEKARAHQEMIADGREPGEIQSL